MSKEKEVLSFIEFFVVECGYAPSVRDIVSGTSLTSTSSADYWLKKLELEKKIKRTAGVSRSIVLTGENDG